jgi:hypothetical protein
MTGLQEFFQLKIFFPPESRSAGKLAAPSGKIKLNFLS